MLRRVLRVLAYPVMTGGAVAFCAVALAHAWPVWLALLVVFGASMPLVALLERLIPYSARWAEPLGDERTDIWHFLFSSRGFDVGTSIAVVTLAPIGAWVSSRFGVRLWPASWPVLAEAALALAIYELPWYAIHRLEHTSVWWFRIHAAHHSARRLHWLTFARNHPIDNVLSALFAMAPLVFLGVGEAALAYVAAFTGVNALLQHANADLRTGPLDWVFSTPRVHRFHHARDPALSLANYGPTLVLWDFVFGTRRFDPARVPPEAVGLHARAEAYPADYLGQLGAPFDATLLDEGAAS